MSGFPSTLPRADSPFRITRFVAVSADYTSSINWKVNVHWCSLLSETSGSSPGRVHALLANAATRKMLTLQR